MRLASGRTPGRGAAAGQNSPRTGEPWRSPTPSRTAGSPGGRASIVLRVAAAARARTHSGGFVTSCLSKRGVSPSSYGQGVRGARHQAPRVLPENGPEPLPRSGRPRTSSVPPWASPGSPFRPTPNASPPGTDRVGHRHVSRSEAPAVQVQRRARQFRRLLDGASTAHAQGGRTTRRLVNDAQPDQVIVVELRGFRTPDLLIAKVPQACGSQGQTTPGKGKHNKPCKPVRALDGARWCTTWRLFARHPSAFLWDWDGRPPKRAA